MSEVSLRISGKEYTVACAPGEESHVAKLGQAIDAKVQSLGDGVNTSEVQKILFGALFLADELHELKKTSAAERETFIAEKASAENELRAAKVAIGQRDVMASKITDLESELEGLQSAHQKHSADVDNMRKELEERRTEAEDLQNAQQAAEAKAAELERERDNLVKQITSKDTLLENANRMIDETNAKLAANQDAADTKGVSMPIDPELAPALERFAELLETCADKLEAQAASS